MQPERCLGFRAEERLAVVLRLRAASDPDLRLATGADERALDG
jgi:hypothetical protein